MRLRHLTLIACVALLPGCFLIAQRAAEQRAQELHDSMSQYKGRPAADVVADLGVPTSVFREGPVTVYRWVWTGSTLSLVSSDSVRTYQRFERIEVACRDGVVATWHVFVQR